VAKTLRWIDYFWYNPGMDWDIPTRTALGLLTLRNLRLHRAACGAGGRYAERPQERSRGAGEDMQGVMWLVLPCCLACPTRLLLVPNPLWLVGTRDEPPKLLRLLMRVTHLLSLFVLTVLALITRWLVPRCMITVLLTT
jgi:hypothetical protein